MHKKNKIKKVAICALFFAGIAFIFGSGNALAKTVTDGNFRITYNEPLFAVTNAAPGEPYSSDMTIENIGGKDRKFQFEINLKGDPGVLAERIFLKIDDISGAGQVCEYGCAGQEETIKNIDRKEFVVKTIPGDGQKIFRFILTLDPSVGNEFQDLSLGAGAGFDMKLGFKDEVTATAVGGGGAAGVTGAAAGAGAPATGGIAGLVRGVLADLPGGGTVAGGETITPSETLLGEVKGELAPKGQVEGAEISTCQSWPKWVWIFMLIIYFSLFVWRTFSKLEEQINKKELRWKWQAGFVAAAFLIWQIFDKCREYRWFIILAVIGGAVIYLYYLFLFRKRLKGSHEVIESGSGEKSPEDPTDQATPIV